jgi:hypothetical protein
MNINGDVSEVGWQRPRISTASTMALPPVNRWDRKVTPAHFLAVLAVCSIGGFFISLGACQFVASVIAKRAQAALGDAFNLD